MCNANPKSLAGATLFAVALLATPAVRGEPQRTPPAPKFDVARFEAAVERRMQGLAKGWAVAVADAYGVRAKNAGGWAQSPGDGDIVMTSKTASGIGSVTKMLSGAALLYQFEQRKLAPQSVDQQLDKPMLARLPPVWQSAWPGRNLERITYRQLLQHRSGFRDESCDGAKLDPLGQMAAGVKVGDIGQLDCYNNHNFYLLRYIISAIAYPSEVATLDQRMRSKPLDEYTEVMNMVSSNLFERYVLREMLPKSLAPLDFTCRPYQLPAKQVAKGYDNADDTRGALLKTAESHKAQGGYCASQGSWYASAEGLAQFGRTLVLSDRWLSAGTRQAMFDPAHASLAYPWAGTVKQADLTRRFGQARFAYHGGAEGGYRAALVWLPGGHVGAALSNSPMDATEANENRGTSQRLAQLLVDAFADATRGPSPE